MLSYGCRQRTILPLCKKSYSTPKLNPSLRLYRPCAKYSTQTDSTPLEKIIRNAIATTGPMPVATYMNYCSSHITEGYYMNPKHEVFGPDGDFITSPEISQVFGELIAIWLITQFNASASPLKIRLVELGPGRGTLMADILRVFKQFKFTLGVLQSVHMVETSDIMWVRQQETLGPVLEDGSTHLVRHQSFEELFSEPGLDVFTMIIAHEFFDALPVHVIEKLGGNWHEVMVTAAPDLHQKTTLNPNGGPLATPGLPPLRLARSRKVTDFSRFLGSSSPRFAKLPSGSRIEVSPSSYKIARRLAEFIGEHSAVGGCALIVDYGDDKAFGNSLRAFKDHKIVDIFQNPGQVDLTTNVDFAYLKESMIDAGSARAHGPITQAKFLNDMGLSLRVSELAQQNVVRAEAIRRATGRLVDLTGMGKQYKFLGITGGDWAKGQDIWPFAGQELQSE